MTKWSHTPSGNHTPSLVSIWLHGTPSSQIEMNEGGLHLPVRSYQPPGITFLTRALCPPVSSPHALVCSISASSVTAVRLFFSFVASTPFISSVRYITTHHCYHKLTPNLIFTYTIIYILLFCTSHFCRAKIWQPQPGQKRQWLQGVCFPVSTLTHKTFVCFMDASVLNVI